MTRKYNGLTELRHGRYICRCPLCGDGVLAEDENGSMKLRCQFCCTEAGGEWDMSRDRAVRVFLDRVKEEENTDVRKEYRKKI
jgi:hypothetical protein